MIHFAAVALIILHFSYQISAKKLCDTLQYNPRIYKCCAGTLHLKPYGSPACCGSQVYNKDNYLCCSDHVTPRPNSTNVGCCDSNGYDKNSEICCRSPGVVFPISLIKKPGCCGGQLIDWSKQICCEGAIVERPKSENVGCCKLRSYDKNTHACVNDQIISLEPECFATCYDIDTEICCKGKVYPMLYEKMQCCATEIYLSHDWDMWNFGLCCNGKLYKGSSYLDYECCGSEVIHTLAINPICCGNVLTYFDSHQHSPTCCGNVAYDMYYGKCCSDGQLAQDFLGVCCNGKRFYHTNFPYTLYFEMLNFCCGDGIYDSVRTVCCSGTVLPLTKASQKCCGEKAYDTTNEICCGTKIYSLPSSLFYIKHCCGDLPYDVYYQVCCNGSLFHKRNNREHYSCCSTEPYLENKQVCCSSVIYDKVENFICCGTQYYNISAYLSCCGKELFNSSTYICCKNKVQPRKGENTTCCGTEALDLSREICCDNTLHKKSGLDKASCCGSRVLDSSLEVCCLDVVNPLKGSCCGYRTYNDSSEICCEGNVYLDPFGTLKCCKWSAYDPSTHICCSNYLIYSGALYDPDSFICCHGVANVRLFRNTKCCGTVAYNADAAVCYTSYQGHFVSEIYPGECHPYYDFLDEYTYNRETQICCQNKIFLEESGSQCCGDLYIQPSHICCSHKVLLHENSNEQCCGEEKYNKDTEICCEDYSSGKFKVHPRTQSNLICCGINETYDSTTKTCCVDDSSYPLRKYKIHTLMSKDEYCCGIEVYDKNTDICCANVVHKNVTSNTKCCNINYSSKGPEAYDTYIQICCSGKVFPNTSLHVSCCGSISYDSNSEICCSKQVFPKSSNQTTCCGGKPYEKGSEKCCDGTVAKHGYDCCYTHEYDTLWRVKSKKVYIFNTKTHICCYGHVIKNQDGRLGCCHDNYNYLHSFFHDTSAPLPIYNTSTQACCQWIPYNANLELCCITLYNAVHIYSDPYLKLQCCQVGDHDVFAFDPETHKCDRDKGVIPKQMSFV